MSGKGIRVALMEYFSKRPGEHAYLNDIAKTTGLTTEQVQHNINNLANDHRRGQIDFNVETVTRGQVWMYRPNQKKDEPARPTKRVFEELGKSKKGTIVIQDEEGNLFEATEL